MCLEEKELVDHLLCIVGGFVCFGICLSLIGFSWVQPFNVKDVVAAWRRKKTWFLGVWRIVPLAIWWAIWKEKNQRIFYDKAMFQDFKLDFLRMLYSWRVVLNRNRNLDFLDL